MPNNAPPGDKDDTTVAVFHGGQPEQITVNYRRRKLTMCHVTETELDAIASLSNSVNMTFFGITFGALISFGITIVTVPIQSEVASAMFSGLTFASLVGTLYFGVRSVIDYRAAKAKLKELKTN